MVVVVLENWLVLVVAAELCLVVIVVALLENSVVWL